MCTGFVKKGNDIIVGYNLDLALNGWDYKVYAKKDMFYVGIKVGSTIYKTHGINKNGNFGNLPYMNDMTKGVYRKGKDFQRLDLLINGYIGGKNSYSDVLNIVKSKQIVNVKNASMHSLLCDDNGSILLIEPGLGYKEVKEDFAAISNFPLMETLEDYSLMWYGKDRFDKAEKILKESGKDFSLADGLDLLKETRQEGEWATRVSFVYSYKEKTVYYVLNNEFDKVFTHSFS